MGTSKHNKALSAKDVDQLMAAVQDLDKSVAYLSKLLQNSLKAQAQTQDGKEEELVLPRKTVH